MTLPVQIIFIVLNSMDIWFWVFFYQHKTTKIGAQQIIKRGRLVFRKFIFLSISAPVKLVGSVTLKDAWNEELRIPSSLIYNTTAANITSEVYSLVDRYLEALQLILKIFLSGKMNIVLIEILKRIWGTGVFMSVWIKKNKLKLYFMNSRTTLTLFNLLLYPYDVILAICYIFRWTA